MHWKSRHFCIGNAAISARETPPFLHGKRRHFCIGNAAVSALGLPTVLRQERRLSRTGNADLNALVMRCITSAFCYYCLPISIINQEFAALTTGAVLPKVARQPARR
jgi:hypothetical protein